MNKFLLPFLLAVPFLFTSSVLADSATFTRNLTIGSRGEEVSNLQKLLSTDISIYPEGLVTGYYGPLTKKAVAAFQKKYGIQTIGVVGPKTLSILNTLTKSTNANPVAKLESPSFLENRPINSQTTVVSPASSNTTSTTAPVIHNVAAPSTSTTTKRVIINYKRNPIKADEDSILSRGGKRKHTFNIIPAIAAEVSDSEVINLSKDPNVASVEIDELVYIRAVQEYTNTWGVLHIGSDSAHASGQTGKTIKVAVLDTGIDYNNTDLNLNYAGGFNFVNGTADPLDDNGHGTHIAGTIAAIKNNVGVVGVAPDVKIYALKVLDAQGKGYTSDIIAALQWSANNGIQIINSSYGTPTNPGTGLQSAFAALEAKGIINVASAGNSGTCLGDTNTTEYPAMYSSVIAVAAIDSSNARPCFSATGNKIELSAPGVNINSTKLGGGNILYNGTSMAAPHVTGVAALLMGMNITDSNGNGRINDEIRNILDSSAIDIGTVGHDNWYGYGLVKADKAIAMANQLYPTTTTTPVATTTPSTTIAPVTTTPITTTPTTTVPVLSPNPTPTIVPAPTILPLPIFSPIPAIIKPIILPITLPITFPYTRKPSDHTESNSESRRQNENNYGYQVKEKIQNNHQNRGQ